jgi:hypothetical protein
MFCTDVKKTKGEKSSSCFVEIVVGPSLFKVQEKSNAQYNKIIRVENSIGGFIFPKLGAGETSSEYIIPQFFSNSKMGKLKANEEMKVSFFGGCFAQPPILEDW